MLVANAPLIETSKPREPEREPTTRAYHYLESVVRLGAADVVIGVTVREDANGELYYNHSIRPGPSTGPLDTAYEAGPGTEGRTLRQDIAQSPDGINLTVRPLDQSYSDGPRGRITFDTGGRSVIELFAARDLSTFIHETGHLYLEELRFDAASPDAPEQLRADWAIVTDWFAANGHAIGEDGVIPTEAHELWARGFERYAMEGKAPSSTLRQAFAAFKSWLLSIYQTADSLRAPVTPEIRDVMNRLLATDDEIAAAAEEQNVRRLFDTAEAAGMTGREFDAYVEVASQAREDARDALLVRQKGITLQGRTRSRPA